MKLPQRKRHRIVWLFIAPVVSMLLLAALAVKPPVPIAPPQETRR